MNVAQIEALLASEGLSPAHMEQFCSAESRVVFTDDETGDEVNYVDTAVDEFDMVDALDRERVLEQWGHLLAQYEDEDLTEEIIEPAEPTGFGFLARGGK